jgi:hypothetical protein
VRIFSGQKNNIKTSDFLNLIKSGNLSPKIVDQKKMEQSELAILFSIACSALTPSMLPRVSQLFISLKQLFSLVSSERYITTAIQNRQRIICYS